MPRTPKTTEKPVASPLAPARSAPQIKQPISHADALIDDSTTFLVDRFDGAWPLTDKASILDFAYALDIDVASRCINARLNFQFVPLSTQPKLGNIVQLITSSAGTPDESWLEFVDSPASVFIKQSLGLPMTPDEWATYENAKQLAEKGERTWRYGTTANQQEHSTQATAATGYLQPGRAGKKLIGAYIDKADAARLKSLLAAQGVTVQEFFADAVTKALTADTSSAQRERLIEAQVERFRANLRANLK